MNVKKQPELPEAVKKWLASPMYQQLKAAQEKYNLLVPVELQTKLKRIKAQHEQAIPENLRKQIADMQRLLNAIPLEAVHAWQEKLAKSDNPEDFAIFHTPEYAEMEKRAEEGNASPIEQEIVKTGKQSKTKVAFEKATIIVDKINPWLELALKITEIYLRFKSQ